MEFKYLIIDTECLSDYFSFQYRNEKMSETVVLECENDSQINELYEVLKKVSRTCFHYSIDYDTAMINFLCKLVEKEYTNINYHLRFLNDLIMKGFNYFQINTFFWCDCFYKDFTFEESIEKTKLKFPQAIYFLDNYPDLLGQSKVFKNIKFSSIPKMMFYYTTKSDRTLIPSISLKNLQLVKEGTNIKIDFGNVKSIKDVSRETFIEYSKNDVDFLYRFFQDNIIPKINEKWQAIEAAKSIKEIEIDENCIYSENNTELIVSLLSIENPEKNIEIDYCDYIKTDNKKFNDFVKFVNDNQGLSDKEIKTMYSDNYIDDDYNQNEELIINSVDEIMLGDCPCKIGFGGIHGAIPNIITENIQQLDYRSQYPSIRLQFKELFSKIMDIELDEGIYNLKCFDLKNQIKDLKLRIKDLEDMNDAVEGIYDEITRLNNLMKGTKLILNYTYGLINSNFKLPISNKTLGRFICLYGQSLIINLASKLPYDAKIINVNTDGILIQTDQEINIEDDGYFVLTVEKFKKIIQKDVNNYIMDYKKKGCFNIKIKQLINTNEKLSQNLLNAINDEVKILPIYFNKKWFDESDKAYYLTTKEKGKQIIKNTVKPQILGMNGETFYFTTDLENADLEIYKRYAEMTKQRMLTFELEKKECINYFEHVLIKDTDENIKEKRKVRRQLMKVLGTKKIGLAGFKGDLKISCYDEKPIKPLIQYNMTQIMESTDCQSLTLFDLIIVDIDIYDKNTGRPKEGWKEIKPLLEKLKQAETFECWNEKTKNFNRKFVFKGSLETIQSKYFEIIKKGIIWSRNKFYDCNFKSPKKLPENLFNQELSY